MNLNLISSVESVLGKGHKTSKGNMSFYCPFCHHSKRKLEIQMETNSIGENCWNCWVCQRRGRKLVSLYKQLNAGYDKINELIKVLGLSNKDINNLFDNNSIIKNRSIQLPKEFKLFLNADNTPDYRNALKYLREDRKFSNFDIIKYQLGFCDDGPYKNKIIIPSYDETGQLNFYVGRDFYGSEFKHKNPQVDKDIIGFDAYINWSLPIILVEGAIDAMTIKRNVIPLFGKIIPDSLRKKIINKKVKQIYICLDNDALKQAIDVAEEFMNEGLEVYFVDLQEKDPNEIGFERMIQILKNTRPLTFGDFIKYKLKI